MTTARILDGRSCASSIKSELTARVAGLKKKPGLGTILVGDDPGSHSYVTGKHRDCAEVGIHSIRIDLPASASQSDVLAAVNHLNKSSECTGYIVQLPLPSNINTNQILEAIDPNKDADGLHPINLGRLVLNQRAPQPCFAEWKERYHSWTWNYRGSPTKPSSLRQRSECNRNNLAYGLTGFSPTHSSSRRCHRCYWQSALSHR